MQHVWETHLHRGDGPYFEAPPFHPAMTPLDLPQLGGKIFREEVFGLVEQVALVALGEKHKMPPAFRDDGVGGFHLRV